MGGGGEEEKASQYPSLSNSYILSIGTLGSATSRVWPRVGYKFVSRMSVRDKEPRPVALTRRVVDGMSSSNEETEVYCRRSKVIPLARAWCCNLSPSSAYPRRYCSLFERKGKGKGGGDKPLQIYLRIDPKSLWNLNPKHHIFR